MTTVVRDLQGKVSHEVLEVTADDNFLTKCSRLILRGRSRVTEDDLVSCSDCSHPKVEEAPKPKAPPRPKPERKPTVRQVWGRKSRTSRRDMSDNLQFALREVIAAIEWNERGEENQFVDNALDRTNLAYRFLGEILNNHGRLNEDE